MCAKSIEKTKNSRKRTQYMCGHMLRWIRIQMKFKPCDMRDCLSLERRTYESYESGDRNIPPDVADAVWEMYRRDRHFMANICRGVMLPSPTPGYSASEWLKKIQQKELEAGIIKISKGNL